MVMGFVSKLKAMLKMDKEFRNESRPDKKDLSWRNQNIGHYGYDKPSKYLFQWSRYLQALISQAGTFMLTGKFHDQECGIHKTEGGCRIEGYGDLVLSHDCCYFDRYASKNDAEPLHKLADLITHIVLRFQPMSPRDSMLEAAAEKAGCDVNKLKDKLNDSYVGGPFGGNALADFFRWNPFSEPPIDREYERWVLVHHLCKKTDAEVDQKYKDLDLGKELLDLMQKKFIELGQRWSLPLCCSPSRDKNGKLTFWVNTGRHTQVDGAKTEKEIRDFLKTATKIIDTARY